MGGELWGEEGEGVGGEIVTILATILVATSLMKYKDNGLSGSCIAIGGCGKLRMARITGGRISSSSMRRRMRSELRTTTARRSMASHTTRDKS